MSAPRIIRATRKTRAHERQLRNKAHEDLRKHIAPVVYMLQDENTKQVLGVLHSFNDFPAWQEKCAEEGIDISHAEMISMPLFVGVRHGA